MALTLKFLKNYWARSKEMIMNLFFDLEFLKMFNWKTNPITLNIIWNFTIFHKFYFKFFKISKISNINSTILNIAFEAWRLKFELLFLTV